MKWSKLPRLVGKTSGDHPDSNNAFRRLCQERSECSSADSAGQLCGDLGWVSRGTLDVGDVHVWGNPLDPCMVLVYLYLHLPQTSTKRREIYPMDPLGLESYRKLCHVFCHCYLVK